MPHRLLKPAELAHSKQNRVSEFIRRYIVVSFVIVVCACITALIYNSNIDSAYEKHISESKKHSAIKHQQLVEHFKGYEEALVFARGFIQASDYVGRNEWRRFVDSAKLDEKYPGVQGFAYVQRVKPTDMKDFVKELRDQGVDSFNLTTHEGYYRTDEDAPHYIIKYDEPEERNQGIVGLDVSAKPANKEVYDRATDRNSAQISSPILLKQQEGTNSKVGLVIAIPHYKNGLPLDTVSQRRFAVRGWVVISLDMNRFVQSVVTNESSYDTVQMSTKDWLGNDAVLFNSNDINPAYPCNKCNTTHQGVESVFSSTFGGRAFNTKITASPLDQNTSHRIENLHADLSSAKNTLLLCIELTLLLAAITLFISHGRSRAITLARNVMDSLRASEHELRQFAYNAQQANKAKSEFLANMSHEIRTPMTAILGYADVLAEMTDQHDDPNRMKRAVNRILSAGDHMLSVINEVLDLSKIESGKLEIRPAPSRIGEILAETRNTMKDRANKANLALNVKFLNPVPATVVIDSYRIRQVLLNLVGNAIKFTNHGTVTIAVRTTKKHIHFEVHDTGVGVEQDRLETLFAPYEQNDSTTPAAHQGTGLGLSISRQLAEMMGGSLTATSTVGLGSVFTCSLPLIIPQGATDELTTELPCATTMYSRDQNSPTNALSGKILVAEDGPDNQKLLEHFLTKAGLDVTIVENGLLALEAINEGNRFDLIVMDMQMPIVDGYQATRTLRNNGHTLPILALTANAMSDDRQKCLQAGCDEYETKPIHKARLLRTVERLLNQQQTKDQLAA